MTARSILGMRPGCNGIERQIRVQASKPAVARRRCFESPCKSIEISLLGWAASLPCLLFKQEGVPDCMPRGTASRYVWGEIREVK